MRIYKMDNHNVTSAQYVQNFDGENVSVTATIDGQEWSVPMDTDNTHYAAILAWVADGNTIQDAD
jgi:hypothetical protein